MAHYIVYETDERTYFLKRMLRDKTPVRDTHIFAPNLTLSEAELTALQSGDELVSGKLDDSAKALCAAKGITVRYLSKDETFMAENARLTAEGALGIILEHSMLSLRDMKVLVAGFGRTGAAVCRLLTELNVDFDVVTSASPRPARAFAAKVFTPSEVDFSLYDVVINTAPAAVFTDEQALSLPAESVYIDLASRPAVNLEMLSGLGLDAGIYPALPAKCCPKSAARAMMNFVTEGQL